MPASQVTNLVLRTSAVNDRRESVTETADALIEIARAHSASIVVSALDEADGLLHVAMPSCSSAMLLLMRWLTWFEDRPAESWIADWAMGIACADSAQDDDHARALCFLAEPNEILVGGSVAVFASHVLGSQVEIVDQSSTLAFSTSGINERVFQVRRRTPSHPELVSDLAWAIRSIDMAAPANTVATDALSSIARHTDDHWSVTVATGCRTLDTRIAADVALGLHSQGSAVMHGAVPAEGCPIRSMVFSYLARSRSATFQDATQQWDLSFESAQLSPRFGHLRSDESATIEAGVATLKRIADDQPMVLVLDGVRSDDAVAQAIVEVLVEELRSSNISLVLTGSAAMSNLTTFAVPPMGADSLCPAAEILGDHESTQDQGEQPCCILS